MLTYVQRFPILNEQNTLFPMDLLTKSSQNVLP